MKTSPDPLWHRVLNQRFTILQPIGSEGMGKVYKAVQAPLGRVVAVRVLQPNGADEEDPDFRKRFFLEASLASKLHHPNSITVIDYGQTTDDIFYIAMEYLDGQTLGRALAKSGPMQWTQAFHVGEQICLSLRQAHKLGLIHRNLQPENVILLDEDRYFDLVKVLNFGSVISGGIDLGSPAYAAPEQTGSQADPRTDVYSLGATLYHMMIGELPLGDFQSVRPDIEIPAQAEAVVMRCLEKEPNRRFQSMDELLEEMQRVVLAVDGWTMPASDLVTPPPMRSIEIPAAPLGDPIAAEKNSAVDLSALPPPKAPGETPPPPPPVEARDFLEKPGMNARLERAPWVPSPRALFSGAPIRALWERWRWVLTGGAAALFLVILTISAVARLNSRKPPAPPVATPRRLASVQAPIEPPAPTPPSEAPNAPTTPSPKSVRFVVASEPPGALVFANGRQVGMTPLTFELPGDDNGKATAELLFTLKGYLPLTVTAGGSGQVILAQRLRPKP